MGKVKKILRLNENDYQYKSDNKSLTIHIRNTGFQKIVNLAAETGEFDRHKKDYPNDDSKIKAALRTVRIPIHRYSQCEIQPYMRDGYILKFTDKSQGNHFLTKELVKDYEIELDEKLESAKVIAQKLILDNPRHFPSSEAIINDLQLNNSIVIDYVADKLPNQDKDKIRRILNNNRGYFLTSEVLKETASSIFEKQEYDLDDIKKDMDDCSSFLFGYEIFSEIKKSIRKTFQEKNPDGGSFVENEYIKSWMKYAIFSFFKSEEKNLAFLSNKSNDKQSSIKPQGLSEKQKKQPDDHELEERTLDINENSTALGKLRDVWSEIGTVVL